MPTRSRRTQDAGIVYLCFRVIPMCTEWSRMILVAQMLSRGGEVGLPRTTERHMRKRADSPREIIDSVEIF